ncbi:aspartic proteinase CDR1-like [Cucurbita maxima]|uniref:Aspartic proteinase CDR1-like n=1 Tax=Cucurbita maxima TaxID=3661 RepID=A0A6J1JNU9_CUCMA|nr:aspartic proteinase CDR1-like [Cucurbita maxima]
MAAISIFFCLLLISFSEATAHGGVGGGGHGFTTSLFHRDSFLSPLYNPSLSRYDRLTNAFRRSFSRSDTLLNRASAVSTTGIHSRIIPDDGEFLMSISIGTPRVKIMAIADTGSDLTWTQCMPCHKCFNQSFPIFNPRRSFSYRHVSCTSNACRSLDDYRCGPNNRTCSYGYSYGDQSFTYGDLASDKITIGSFKLFKTVIGCGHVNGGTFSGDTSGIIGLGGGPLSLISQFYPKKSSSFSHVPCTSDTCKSVDDAFCGEQGSCDYSFAYADHTYSKGEFGTDTITIGSMSVNMLIGCGHESGGGFGNTSGVIGLGGNDLSIVTQMSKKSAVSWKFSYCLPSVSSQGRGKINFGENAVVSGPGVVSTLLDPSMMYQMSLEAISVGNERHAADISVATDNMIIDSGTTLTYIPKVIHGGVVSLMAKIIGSKRVNDPGNVFALCYSSDGDGVNIQTVTTHFAGGVNVELSNENMFITVADGVSGLMFKPLMEINSVGIWGNIAQANFLIGYDLEKKSLSFKLTVCA